LHEEAGRGTMIAARGPGRAKRRMSRHHKPPRRKRRRARRPGDGSGRPAAGPPVSPPAPALSTAAPADAPPRIWPVDAERPEQMAALVEDERATSPAATTPAAEPGVLVTHRRRGHRAGSAWVARVGARKLLYVGIALFVALLVFAVLRWLEVRDLTPPPPVY
jgi:hypothetical protein